MGLVFTIHTQKSGQRETSLGNDPADAILATALGVTDEHSIFFSGIGLRQSDWAHLRRQNRSRRLATR